MKTTNFNLLKWLCSIVMVAMGFSSCKDAEPDDIYFAYGTPTCDYKISGVVKNEKYKPIPGINVVFQARKGGIMQDVLVMETDKDGKFETDYFDSEDIYITEIKFIDIDGEENYGDFEEKSIRAWGMTRNQVEEGDGDWYSGKFDLYDEIRLKKKPVEDTTEPEAPAEEEGNEETEE
ncbi:MAG: radical SAM-associated putative lipoprotein [Alistipes sp.]|nr:radical SAM-associated putative lipoprotein [Alistipes sp.]